MRILLFVLLTLGISVHATVIVYKGIGRCASPAAIAQFSGAPHVYYVADVTNNKGYLIHYYSIKGKKGSLDLPQDDTHYVAQAITATKTLGAFGYVFDTSTGSDEGTLTTYLRGTVTKLELTTTGGGSFGNYPKTLAGIFRETERNGQISELFEINYVLTFDAVHTQLGNNAFKDGVTVAMDIQNDLSVKGY